MKTNEIKMWGGLIGISMGIGLLASSTLLLNLLGFLILIITLILVLTDNKENE